MVQIQKNVYLFLWKNQTPENQRSQVSSKRAEEVCSRMTETEISLFVSRTTGYCLIWSGVAELVSRTVNYRNLVLGQSWGVGFCPYPYENLFSVGEIIPLYLLIGDKTLS